jgi:hypothetical protein
VSVSFSFIKKPLIMDGFRFCFLYFSFLHLVGNTVLVVSPGFILLIKSVRAAVPLFTKRSFAVAPVDWSNW